jgi:hypothetical protein
MLQQSRNQENVRVEVKNVVLGARSKATKRSALEEIRNDPIVPRQVGGDKVNAPLEK